MRTNAVRGTKFAHRIVCFPFVKSPLSSSQTIKSLFYINKK